MSGAEHVESHAWLCLDRRCWVSIVRLLVSVIVGGYQFLSLILVLLLAKEQLSCECLCVGSICQWRTYGVGRILPLSHRQIKRLCRVFLGFLLGLNISVLAALLQAFPKVALILNEWTVINSILTSRSERMM